MDPKETLRLLRLAIASRRWQDAYQHAWDLLGWLQKGGFVPRGEEPVTVRQVPYNVNMLVHEINERLKRGHK